MLQLDKFRGQLADVEKEKKSLSGKSGQQARDLKETKDGLMVRALRGCPASAVGWAIPLRLVCGCRLH